jgi:hypothetical protein
VSRSFEYPVAFAVVSLLGSDKALSTDEIAKAIGRSVPRTSNSLGTLRPAEVVRYETSTDRVFR